MENKIVKYNNQSISNLKIDTEDAIEKGKLKIDNNDFLKELTELMENKKFRDFFNKYMNDWMGIKSTVTYMKLYDELKKKYKEINDEELDKNITIFLLTKIMRNRELLPASIKTIDQLFENNKLDFLEELERNIQENILQIEN